MSSTSSQPLRVGVVGLGRLWEARHKPAFRRRPDLFRIRAVYDHVRRRAEMEAVDLDCDDVDSLSALVERPDLDALFLLSPQWFGLQAARLAVAAGKPVYCALPLACDLEGLEQLAHSVAERQVAFVPEQARRFYPATVRLQGLLASNLGRPQLALGQTRLVRHDRYGVPGPTTQLDDLPLVVDPGCNLIDWCRLLFGCEPRAVQAFATPEPQGDDRPSCDFVGFLLEFPGGGVAEMNIQRHHRQQWGGLAGSLPAPGFQVYAERGVAWLELPDRILWSDPTGTHEERLPLDPGLGEVLHENFWKRLRGEPSLSPTIQDALASARLAETLLACQLRGRKLMGRGAVADAPPR